MATFRSLRPLLRTPAALSAPTAFRRHLHERVPLAYALEGGVGSFLSPEALQTVAVDWQQGVLERLNELVRGTEYEGKTVLQTVKATASDPSQSLAFNYASEALNNSFFLSTLTATPTPVNASTGSPLTSTSSFSQSLASSPLGSFSSLVSHFSAHVAGLHPSSGAYVWLVMDGSKNLGVVGTYAGGTVLVHQRMQVASGAVLGERVLGEPIAPTVPVVEGDSPSTWVDSPSKKAKSPASSSSTFANILKPEFMAPVAGVKTGAQLYPLTCISVHPHCYLKDYGLWGREEYVKNWWSAVDWGAVERNFDAYAAKNTRG